MLYVLHLLACLSHCCFCETRNLFFSQNQMCFSLQQLFSSFQAGDYDCLQDLMCCLIPLQSTQLLEQAQAKALTNNTGNRSNNVSSSDSNGKKDEESPILTASRHLLQPNGSISGQAVGDIVLQKFPTFGSAIPTQMRVPRPALASIDGRAPVTHARIHRFVWDDFGPALHQLGFGRGDRIALVLPNGPELALALVATAHWASAVPLNANGAVSELQADLRRCGATLVIGPYSGTIVNAATTKPQNSAEENDNDRFHVVQGGNDKDWSAFRSIEKCARELKIPFCGIVPSPTEAGIFRLQPTTTTQPVSFDDAPPQPLESLRRDGTTTKPCLEPNAADDECLLLFTSGTTGNKKLVPHLMGDMLIAATTIALSWDLTPTDMNCNLMPLFHVGGIVRQVFSPLFSGGGVICCPSFDPFIFWALLEKEIFTWYYAAPTMHQLILQTGRTNGFIHKNRKQLKLRMIANAAGGLLPSLAEEMMDAFDANVRGLTIIFLENLFVPVIYLLAFLRCTQVQLTFLVFLLLLDCRFSLRTV